MINIQIILRKNLSNIIKIVHLFANDPLITQEAVISKLKISKNNSFQLAGKLVGETYNQDKHGYGVEIKAISYHQLLVQEGPPAQIRVILDL